MPRALLRIADLIDMSNAALGRLAALCLGLLVAVQFAIVVLRGAFGSGSVWLQDSLYYFHAGAFLLAAAFALKNGVHVRVDIFFEAMSVRARALVDLLGALVLMVPFMAAIMILSWPYASRAIAILEGARDSGGLPLVFLLKALIPLFAFLMALQGIAQAIRAIGVLIAARPHRMPS